MTDRDDWTIWDDKEPPKGEEVAAYWRATLSTKGALTVLEQRKMAAEIQELTAEEYDQFELYWERGWCIACGAGGQAEPAGYGPDGEYCEACAAEVGE